MCIVFIIWACFIAYAHSINAAAFDIWVVSYQCSLLIRILAVLHIIIFPPSSFTSFQPHIRHPSISFQNIVLSRYNTNHHNTLSSHWQLKDLVCKSSESNAVYFPHKNAVSRLNFRRRGKHHQQVKKAGSNVHMDTSSRLQPEFAKFGSSPRCLKESNGIIVAGGIASRETFNDSSTLSYAPSSNSPNSYRWKGFFGLHVGETGYTENGNIGTLINNCITINKIANSRYMSLACNNDQNLYVMDISNKSDAISPDYSVNLSVALNHASLSPDMKTLVTLGDSPRIFIMHPEENMREVAKRETIVTQSDCGFSTCWNNSGTCFSACFQEGVNFIYDIRNISRPIHKIYSTRKQLQSGAFRVCKFSGGTDDLLFISEHQGRVHVVDTRDFMTHHVILLPKRLYDDSDGYYNQPIVKKYDDVCDVDHRLGYPRTSRMFLIDVDKLQKSNFFNFNRNNCPKRYPVAKMREDAVEWMKTPYSTQPSTKERELHEQIVCDPLQNACNSGTRVVRTPIRGRGYHDGVIQNPQNDPFYYLDSELELTGLEIVNAGNEYGNGQHSLVIGSDDGLIHWDIDSWRRRCFPSYELA